MAPAICTAPRNLAETEKAKSTKSRCHTAGNIFGERAFLDGQVVMPPQHPQLGHRCEWIPSFRLTVVFFPPMIGEQKTNIAMASLPLLPDSGTRLVGIARLAAHG